MRRLFGAILVTPHLAPSRQLRLSLTHIPPGTGNVPCWLFCLVEYIYVCVLSCFRHVWLFAALWTVARQAPLSVGFSRQERWSGLPCPPPGSRPSPGVKPASPRSPALAGEFFATSATTHMYVCARPIENWTHVSCVSCTASGFFLSKPPGSPTCVYVCVYTHRRCKGCRFDPWVMKTPWRRAWQPTPVFLPGESHGQWSLAGHRPRGHKESDTT